MTRQIISWLTKIRQEYKINEGKVLDVGALDINGSAREVFGDLDYTGVDMQEGKGVDVVLNGHDLHKKYEPNSFKLVLCLETFEHDVKFWETLANIRAITSKYLIISTPTANFPIHRYPRDYYRFLPDIFEDLFFADMQILEIEKVVSKGVNPGLIGIAKK